MCFLDTSHYQTCKFENILPFCGLYFHLLESVIWVAKGFHFYKIQFVFFFFVAYAFGVILKVHGLTDPKSWRLIPMLSSKSFIVIALIIRVFDSFWVKFYIWCEVRVQLHFFAWISISLATIYWKDYPFPTDWSWLPCWPEPHRFTAESSILIPLIYMSILVSAPRCLS